MTLNESFFGNPFSQRAITSERLANTIQNCLNRVEANNPGNNLTNASTALTLAYGKLRDEIADVDQAGGVRKAKTRTLDLMLDGFRAYMRDEEPFLARALGGRDSELFIQLYPLGITEYTEAPKKDLPTLMARVGDFGAANGTALGAATAAKLQEFSADWTAFRNEQGEAKGEVSSNIAERSAARVTAELALLSFLHKVAELYPGNIETCRQYIDFNLLYPPGYLGSEEEPSGPTPDGGGTDQ